MVVSKALSGSTPATIALAHFVGRSKARVWQLTTGGLAHPPDVDVLGNAIATSLPAQSVTLFVVPPAGGALYTVPPCRIVDTRLAPGPSGGPSLTPGAARTFRLAGSCGIPATATSVAVNVTVVGPGAAGHLSLYPDGSTPSGTSTVNFRTGQTRANNAVLTLGASGGVTALAAIPSGKTDFVLDVTGYFE